MFKFTCVMNSIYIHRCGISSLRKTRLHFCGANDIKIAMVIFSVSLMVWGGSTPNGHIAI